MLAAITQKYQISPLYDRLFLARALFREGRLGDSGTVYTQLERDAPNTLSPDDFARWVASVPAKSIDERIEILKRAITRFPEATGFQFLLGLLYETHGMNFGAVDAYFIETNKFSNSMFQNDAAPRIFKPINQGPKGSLENEFKLALMGYFLAEKIKDPQLQAELFAASYQRFSDVAKLNGSFAALMYAAKTRMYLAFLQQNGWDQAKRALQSVLVIDPHFRPAYGHLALIAVCQN